MKIEKTPVPHIVPNPGNPRLTEALTGADLTGATIEIKVPMELPLTLFLNGQEVAALNTLGDHPEYLALGYLLNQNVLKSAEVVTAVEYHSYMQVVVVRTERPTDFEEQLKSTGTSARTPAFGNLVEALQGTELPKARFSISWFEQITQAIDATPSLSRETGEIHGCVLCREGTVVCYTEDVNRPNAADKIAGWMHHHGVDPADKFLYTAGPLTAEMVIKTVRMGIPVLVSRSGFTTWGVELAQKFGLMLIGSTPEKGCVALAGQERIVFDHDGAVEKEFAEPQGQGA